MEPNVDRGMWSVVALLAAIVIGGVVLLAFPKISGKITNSMDKTVNKAFDGEMPEWVLSQGEEEGHKATLQNQVNFLKEAKKLEVPNPGKPTFYHYFKNNVIHEHVVGNYQMEEWGVNDASKIKMTLGTRVENTKSHMFYLQTAYGHKPKSGERIIQLGLIKNEGEGTVIVINNSNFKEAHIKPGETRLIVLDGASGGYGYLQTHFTYHDEDKTKEIELTYYGFSIIDSNNAKEYDKLKQDFNIK